jgi:hypothetical protein
VAARRVFVVLRYISFYLQSYFIYGRVFYMNLLVVMQCTEWFVSFCELLRLV